MSSTGPTSRNYERRLARQRQLELMEAAASGMPVDLMELDLSERSEEITFDHSTAENVRSSQSQPSSQRSSSVRSSAIFERGDAYSSRPAVNLMDHTTGIYEADEVKSGSSLLAGIFRVGGKKGRRSSADYPRDADEQDDEFSTLKTGGKGRLNPFGAACQRLWRTKYCLIAIILGSIAIICFVTILLVRTPEDVKHVQTEKTRLNNIMDFILDNGMGHIDHLVNNTNRAEYHALRWVAFTDGARLEPTDPYVLQRYSLATFFFGSFLKYQQVAGVQQLHEEEVWEDVPNPGWIRRDYWLSEKSHCLWYGVDCAAECRRRLIGQQRVDRNDRGGGVIGYDTVRKGGGRVRGAGVARNVGHRARGDTGLDGAVASHACGVNVIGVGSAHKAEVESNAGGGTVIDDVAGRQARDGFIG